VAVGDAIAIRDTAIITRKRGRANFATAADHAAEKAIIARLSAHDADIPILAEESARKGLAGSERLWVVDPIDGTLNFSQGLPISYLAMGRFDLFVHSALSPWDVAAPALIAREAGAVVLSLKTGKDATWNERQVVIANPRLAKEAVKLLAKPRM